MVQCGMNVAFVELSEGALKGACVRGAAIPHLMGHDKLT